MPQLPDVNVWLAVAFDTHIHHPAAKAWFDSLANDVSNFCRLTQMGFLRLATNRKVLGDETLSLPDAWAKYDLLQADSCVSFLIEPSNLEPHWRTLTQDRAFSHSAWNDAYLAAFAQAADMELVTFDRGFVKFSELKCTILS